MNSLTELNGFVNDFSLTYTDDRLPNVIFDRAIPTNQSQSVDRGFTINASIGLDIIEIINYPESNPVYTIDVSNLSGATITWATLPSGVTVTNTIAGVYVVRGFTDKTEWDIIKSPVIDFSDDYFGNWTYTSTISYTSFNAGSQSKTWNSAVTVNNILFLSNPIQYVYQLSAVSTISGVPQLGNLDTAYPGVTWTVVITPSSTVSINTFTSTGTGGTFSVNASTKVVTISGTRAQVNSRLAGLRIDANSTAVDFVLTYVASNSLNAVTDTKTQTLISQGLSVLGAVTEPIIYFIEDSNFTITGAPVITDIGFDGTGLYIYTITPNDTNAIQSATIGGTGGTASFNATTKVITIQGTRTQVNGRLASINIVTGVDYGINFNLQYQCVTPRADTANKIQVVAVGSNDTEITNMNISRKYTANNSNLIFSTNIPQISDLDATDPTYTVIFDCAQGTWNVPANLDPFVEGGFPTNPLSIAGTKTFINSRLSQIRFFPNQGVSSNTSFTYTQFKNGVQQVSQTVALIGSAGSFNNSRTVDFVSSQNYTPSSADILYGKIDSILLVGGGGGGSAGGGGGGEIIYSTTDINLTNTTYNIVIGGGGTAGNANLSGSGGAAGGNGGNTVAFGLTARGGGGGNVWTGANPFTGATGGYSWDSAGTQISGGNGGTFSQTVSGQLRLYYGGGGGAGARLSTDPAVTLYTFTSMNASTSTNPGTLVPGYGATGRNTAEFANPFSLGGVNANTVYSYGFGGGGGAWSTYQFANPGGGGYADGSPEVPIFYSDNAWIQWASYSGRTPEINQATSASKFVSGQRVPSVAGGGGGGGALSNSVAAPPAPGGDGVVRISISAK
jgi:hypothetical protein